MAQSSAVARLENWLPEPRDWMECSFMTVMEEAMSQPNIYPKREAKELLQKYLGDCLRWIQAEIQEVYNGLMYEIKDWATIEGTDREGYLSQLHEHTEQILECYQAFVDAYEL